MKKGAKVGIGVLFVVMVGVLSSESDKRETAESTSPTSRSSTSIAQSETPEKTREYQVGLARFALKQRARDPESMQFRNETMYTRGDTLVVCGEVNAKNGFGGYTGFTRYVGVRGAVVTDADAEKLGQGVVDVFFNMCANSAP